MSENNAVSSLERYNQLPNGSKPLLINLPDTYFAYA
jgi:hypothetical protein